MPGMEERSMMEKTIKRYLGMISSVSYSTHIAGNAGRADQKFLNICRKVLLIMIWIRYMNSLMRMRGEKV